jgi:aryl-alcohol dehydrogenase-like predicted oxidoreductase
MRYRSFNQTGLAASAITLTLDEAPMSQKERIELVFAALELGINSFELACWSPDCLAAIRAAIEAAGRDVLILMLRRPPAKQVDGGHQTLDAEVRACLDQIGSEGFDVVMIGSDGSPSVEDTTALHGLRAQGLTRMIGVTCGRGGPTVDLTVGYDVIATPFGLRSDAGLRKRLRAMSENNITLIGYHFDDMVQPAPVVEAPKRMSRLFRRPAAASESDPYEFLRRTPEWSADALALAYALTETTLATVRVQTTDIEKLSRLAMAVERTLPPGASAQIEMARFTSSA